MIKEYLEATIVEVEIIEVEFVEEDLITVNFNTIDVIQDRAWVVQTVKDCFVFNEAPTKVTAKRFRANNEYIQKTLQVVLNGIKEKHITIHSNTDFSFPIDTVITDDIEISYIKL